MHGGAPLPILEFSRLDGDTSWLPHEDGQIIITRSEHGRPGRHPRSGEEVIQPIPNALVSQGGSVADSFSLVIVPAGRIANRVMDKNAAV